MHFLTACYFNEGLLSRHIYVETMRLKAVVIIVGFSINLKFKVTDNEKDWGSKIEGLCGG